METTLSSKLEDARQMMQLKLVKSFKEYRNLYAVQHRLGGRLVFPDSLKYLPLYILALCKSWALRGGYADMSLDERCTAGFTLMVLPIAGTLQLLYPALYRMDELLTKVIIFLFYFALLLGSFANYVRSLSVLRNVSCIGSKHLFFVICGHFAV